MSKYTFSNIKLGTLVLSSLLFLVLLLYMIGKNQHLFGSNYILKARFENVQGLVTGNNVRFAGIGSGTVKKIDILDDSTIEVTMLIDKKLKGIIRSNAVARIGTEGFVGNKVVNIFPVKQAGPVAKEGDILSSARSVDTDEILQTLSKTNDDIANIAAGIKNTVQRLNSDNGLWYLLNDKTIPKNVQLSVARIHSAAVKMDHIALNVDNIVNDVKNGKGTAGMILKDSSMGLQIAAAIWKINEAGNEFDSLAANINQMITGIQNDINNGKGVVKVLLKDSLLSARLTETMDNIQKGTDGFNQNMEALKHNIFFRGYFKKLEKQRQKESKAVVTLRQPSE